LVETFFRVAAFDPLGGLSALAENLAPLLVEQGQAFVPEPRGLLGEEF
jgi:hypothetical protein